MEIKVQRVNYSYYKRKEKVLNDVNVTFPSSKITGIIGSTGAGKSTLLDLLAIEKVPTSGKIEIGDLIISRKTLGHSPKEIGYVSQFPKDTFYYETVEKEISSVLEKYNYKAEKRETHMKQALKMVGLDSSYLNRDPYSLSNGETRLIALARAISYNPKVLLLDEPTVGLDVAGKKFLITILTMMKSRYHKTIIIASHDVDFLSQISDNLFILKEGKSFLFGNKKDVLDKVDVLVKNQIPVPKITLFENQVKKEKGVLLGRRSEINDLVKDILRKQS